MANNIINPFQDVENIDPEPALLGGLTSDGASQNLFGVININNNRIQIDGNNGRIIVRDSDTNRILIGYQENGF